jgi:uncharacterized Fe-S center protein
VKSRAKDKGLPSWLRYRKGKNEKSPVWFIDVRGTDFTPESPLWQERVNAAIGKVLRRMRMPAAEGPVLIKCHVGERRCRTRMLPQYCLSTVEHFRARGIRRIACGDSTVAYSGDRGYHDNIEDCTRYAGLARSHGWDQEGPLGTPFVILDRPQTSVRGRFSFTRQERRHRTASSMKFREVFLSGGFAAAGTIVNHVHLTLHDMAQVACCVKGLTMGGSSYRGKLIMHKCYSPEIDAEGCLRCGTCSLKCPEGALRWEKGQVPRLSGDLCIGCGECVAICHGGSISMSSSEIEDWSRGGDSLPYRMSDYLMGMMEGRWQRLINVAHLYNITRKCDCVDRPQRPMLRHIGFLIGKNPFSVDLLATRLLHDEVYRQAKGGGLKGGSATGPPSKALALRVFFDNYHGAAPYRHIRDSYGVVVEPEVRRLRAR